MISRRQFVGTSAAVAALSMVDRRAMANPLGLPLGVQLYSVRKQMAEDLAGALAGVRAAGFTQVEAASLPKKPAKEIRAALDAAGLKCVSAHVSFVELRDHMSETVAFYQEVGVKYIVCPSPGMRPEPSGAASSQRNMTLDDWTYTAESLNRFGDALSAKSIRLAYHNHYKEFLPVEGKTPYLQLLHMTDPKKMSFEMDCGWVIVGGADPVKLMQTYPHRFSMLHVKDFKLPAGFAPGGENPPVTELGQGTIDYRPIFAQAAKTQHIDYAFVEQEEFDMPWQESLKVDAEYMRKL